MARLPHIRSIISARGVRVAVALLLIGVGVWAFAPYVAYRVSSSAFVNSEISRVRAPIEGYLSSELPRKGKFIESRLDVDTHQIRIQPTDAGF